MNIEDNKYQEMNYLPVAVTEGELKAEEIRLSLPTVWAAIEKGTVTRYANKALQIERENT